ncbi:hypothetical protein EDI28_14015 [Photobacterium chitinilyticum]|uniref:Uncharacterized protein n=1 Tax=Photobacterium chitinilyticum TaxID=2485123 RepID=A0A444JP65_9GAMM|nr:hypothetical protein EDI28_14015 [Photobacterium chitinilyticum]
MFLGEGLLLRFKLISNIYITELLLIINKLNFLIIIILFISCFCLINKTISYELIGYNVRKQTKTVKKVTFYLVMIGMYMRMGDHFGCLVRYVECYRYKAGGMRFAGFSLLQ